jgi:hypothetical protein
MEGLKFFTEKELREISREVINIIKGKSEYAGTKPFNYGKHQIKNCLVRGFNYQDKNIGMFNIIKDFSKRGSYVLQGLHYFDGKVVFEIPFTSKTEAKELYVMIGDKYDEYQKQFNKYELQLTDNNNIKIYTDWNIENVKKYYIGKWFKDNRWFSLLAVGDDLIYPKCMNVVM